MRRRSLPMNESSIYHWKRGFSSKSIVLLSTRRTMLQSMPESLFCADKKTGSIHFPVWSEQILRFTRNRGPMSLGIRVAGFEKSRSWRPGSDIECQEICEVATKSSLHYFSRHSNTLNPEKQQKTRQRYLSYNWSG